MVLAGIQLNKFSVGELWISGISIAKEYYNDSFLTKPSLDNINKGN